MTRKIYKSAMGKSVDLGALLLQNEQVRAVGNMGVNAAGDLVDSTNKVIDQRNRVVQRTYHRQTNVSARTVATSNLDARKRQTKADPAETLQQQQEPAVEITSTVVDAPVVNQDVAPASGGLAAAIARSREVKQELEKTRRQQMQEQGIKKI